MIHNRYHLRSLLSLVALVVIAVATAAGSVFADSNETASGSANAPHQSSIALGKDHSCALLGTGTVKC